MYVHDPVECGHQSVAVGIGTKQVTKRSMVTSICTFPVVFCSRDVIDYHNNQ
jgi:hypothetical protein